MSLAYIISHAYYLVAHTMHHLYSIKQYSRLSVDKYQNDIDSSLNRDLERLLEWAKMNFIVFYANKTQYCLLPTNLKYPVCEYFVFKLIVANFSIASPRIIYEIVVT